MLHETTLIAIRALVYIALEDSSAPHPPAEIARQLGASQQYLGKVHTQLVKAGILKSRRGAGGGVLLARPPESITLLEIVETCQGRILGDYCQPHDDLNAVCAFHAAMQRVQSALIASLSTCTLADLAAKPVPDAALRGKVLCKLACAIPPRYPG